MLNKLCLARVLNSQISPFKKFGQFLNVLPSAIAVIADIAQTLIFVGGHYNM